MYNPLPELRIALRQLRRQPGFVAAVLLALALGVAAVTTVFALIDATLLRPLAVPAGERLLGVHRQGSTGASISLPDAIAWRRELRSIDAFAVVSPQWSLDWVRADGPVHLDAGLTESEFFRALALPPLHGRLLQPADDLPGAAAVAVLGEGLWRREFGADPAVLGSRINLSGVSTEIVGVVADAADLWESSSMLWVGTPAFAGWAATSAGSNNFEAVARLAEGATLATARAELATVNQRLIDAATIGEHKRIGVRPLLELLTEGAGRGLWLVLGFAGLVLLLAGVNVAALLLVRMAARSGELRVRHALGAGRSQIRRQLLAEGGLLGLAGGALGIVLALAGFELVQALASAALPRLAAGGPGLATLAFALAATVLTSAGFSLVAARWCQQQVERGASAAGARAVGTVPQRLLSGFVLAEVALAVLLLAASALLLRSYAALRAEPLGFDPAHVLAGGLVLPDEAYGSRAPQSAAIERIVAGLAQTPGVRHAGFVVGLPLSGSSVGHSFVIDGQPATVDNDAASARFRPFHGDYFAAVGLEVRSGRAPTAADLQPGERLAWINQRFADTWFAGRDPVGQRIAWTPGEASDAKLGPQWMRIIGVVADTRSSAVREGDVAALYAPYLQRDDEWIRFGQLVAKVEGAPDDWRQAMQAAVTAVDGSVALATLAPLQQRVDVALQRDRLQLQLVLAFGAIAALLGLQGIFGVVAFVAAQRRREIGLRLALGAPHQAIVGWLLRGGLKPLAGGIVLGLLGCLLLSRSFAALLYGIEPNDPASYAAVAVLTLLGGLAATWLPARRARRVDPLVALRD